MMAENRLSRGGSFSDCLCGNKNDMYCIEADRILDSCKDRDCFENARVFLSDFGNEIIERTGSVRVKCATVAYTSIHLENVQFNRGFYAVCIRFFVKLELEACIGGRSQEFDGIAVLDKKVILYGGESTVHTFKSDCGVSDFCTPPDLRDRCSDAPTAIVQLVEPIVLSCTVVEEISCCNCCCCCCDIPDTVSSYMSGAISDGNGRRYLAVSLGIFSVIRIERPSQLLLTATDYSVPDKECTPRGNDDNPCRLFRTIAFPIGQFRSSTAPQEHPKTQENGCGCQGRANEHGR
jgi:hypothetical protein